MQCLFYTEQMSTQTILKAIRAIQAARACITWEENHNEHPKYTIEGGLELSRLPKPPQDQSHRKVATLLYYFDNLPRSPPATKLASDPDLMSVVLKDCKKSEVDVTVRAQIANLGA